MGSERGSERRKALEEAVRLLESVRAGSAGEEDFDDARMGGHITTALTAAKAALAVANREMDQEGPVGPQEAREP